MSKRNYDSEKTREIIIEKATMIFAQKGFNRTSIQDISNASGFSKGHIYYHFGNKEKLFVFLAQITMQKWHQKWLAKEPNYVTATEKLYGVAIHVLYNYQTPLLRSGQELASNPSSNPESVKQLYELAVVPMSVYRSILQEGIEHGEFKTGSVEEWTTLLGTWLGGLCQLTYHEEQLSKLEPLFTQAITIFLNSISK